MMAYKYGNREQITLLPETVDSYVGEDDPVRAYDAFIDAFDLKGLGLEINDNSVGNSSYDPISMLKVLVYGYSYGWRSSRKLERALHHNLSFIWLAGGLKPDHKTIANFRKNNKSILKNVLKQCVRMCMKLDLIDGNVLFVDGSKFRANAGNSQTKSKEAWTKILSSVETRIEQLLNDCQKIDDGESESLVKMKSELKSKEKLKAKIGELIEEIKEDKAINGTDPDCKIMKSRQGSHAGYNAQFVVDEANGLIASTDAVDEVTDRRQLNEQVEKAEAITGKVSEIVCADAGYHKVDALKPLLDNGRVVIVPSSKQAEHHPKNNPFDKSNFSYNAEKDIYICPDGKEMYRSHQAIGTNRITYRMKKEGDCRACKHYGICTSAKRGRNLYRLVNEHTQTHLKDCYDSSLGQVIYVKRKMKVELPFGHIKRNLGAGAFLLRGLKGVNAELSILASCFNITRLITLLGGVRPMIQQIKQMN